jgi:integral membrane sensor domain MASE1/anti-sigma regulatory factor (Ser/Thr protein kinase)
MQQQVHDLDRWIRRTPRRTYLASLLAVGLAYYLAAQLGLRLSLVERTVTPLWPPTGVAVVAMVFFGRKVWPAVAVAAFAVNAPLSDSLETAALIALGNTLAPLLAATLLDRMGFRSQLDRVRDALALVFLGALVSMTVSATVGSLALIASDAIDADQFPGTWSVWWTGDAMGVLIVAPFLWSLQHLDGLHLTARRVLEVVVLLGALAAACAVVFASPLPLMYVAFPVLGCVAWRFELRGAAPAALIVSTVATWAAVHPAGTFEDMSLVDKMVTLQTFNATVALTALFVASAVSQRERRAEREHKVVETLQRSLLPDGLEQVPGVAVAARYIPASTEVTLGGDWYDIMQLRDGRLGFAVGDVVGHGVDAAAVMGQIRMALRAYASEDLSPGVALTRLNGLLRDLRPTAMATVWYAQYDPAVNVLSCANAGHLPPLLLDPVGPAAYLETAPGPPLGALSNVVYPQSECALAQDTVLLLYTDGLIERRDQSIDEGLRVLRERAVDVDGDLELLCDHLIRSLLLREPTDDVALLAIRPVSFDRRHLRLARPATPGAVPDARRIVRSWLHQNAVAADDLFDILVASSEAFANAVQHAYGLDTGVVEVEGVVSDAAVELAIRDRGQWRARRDSHGFDGGRGVVLMRALMDSVVIETTEAGTLVRMRRSLKVAAGHG